MTADRQEQNTMPFPYDLNANENEGISMPPLGTETDLGASGESA